MRLQEKGGEGTPTKTERAESSLLAATSRLAHLSGILLPWGHRKSREGRGGDKQHAGGICGAEAEGPPKDGGELRGPKSPGGSCRSLSSYRNRGPGIGKRVGCVRGRFQPGM